MIGEGPQRSPPIREAPGKSPPTAPSLAPVCSQSRLPPESDDRARARPCARASARDCHRTRAQHSLGDMPAPPPTHDLATSPRGPSGTRAAVSQHELPPHSAFGRARPPVHVTRRRIPGPVRDHLQAPPERAAARHSRCLRR